MSLDALKPPTGNASLVFRISLGIAATVSVWALVDPDSLTSLASAFTLGALEKADWFFLLSATMLLVISLALGFSRFGRMRPGRDDQRPEFSPAPTDGGDATDAAVAQSRVP